MPAGVSPETWPILAAFLGIQVIITVPLIVYIRSNFDRQIAFLQRLLDQANADRDRLLAKLESHSEKMYGFTDAMAELRDAVKDLTRARQGR